MQFRVLRQNIFYSLFSSCLFAFSIFSYSNWVWAESSNLIVLEPYFGGSKSVSGEQNLIFGSGDPGQTEVSYWQGLAGMRIAYAMDGISLGLDGTYYFRNEVLSEENKDGVWTWDGQAIGKETYDFSRVNAGVNLGWRTSFLIWGAYYPIAKMWVDSTSQSGVFRRNDKLEGSGYGGGIGYTFFPHFTINLEYRHFEYKNDFQYSHDVAGSMRDNFIVNEAIAALSFPVAF